MSEGVYRQRLIHYCCSNDIHVPSHQVRVSFVRQSYGGTVQQSGIEQYSDTILVPLTLHDDAPYHASRNHNPFPQV